MSAGNVSSSKYESEKEIQQNHLCELCASIRIWSSLEEECHCRGIVDRRYSGRVTK